MGHTSPYLNRAKLFYFFFYGGQAALVPFLTLYYQSLGLGGVAIGLLAGLVPLASMVAGSLWNAAADATRRYRLVLLLTVGGSWLATLLVSRAAGLATLLPAVLLMAIFGAPIAPLVDSSVVALLGPRRADYGRVRLWGSIGWALAALLAGPVLERNGLSWMFVISLALSAVVFVIALRLPLAQSAAAPGTSFGARLGVLLRERGYLTLLVVALVFGMGLSITLSYLSLHLRALGAGESVISLVIAIFSISEIPFLFLSSWFLRRLGINSVIALALLLTAARLFIYAWLPTPGWAVVVSLLHGPAYALLWSAGVAESYRLAPAGLGATAQNAYSMAMFGLGSAIGSFAGGVVYARYGAPFLFQATGWLLLLTLAAFLIRRKDDKSQVPGPRPEARP